MPCTRTVLGLKSPEGYDWSRLHGPQYALLAERVSARLVLNLFGVGYILHIFLPILSGLWLSLWATSVVLLSLQSARMDYAMRDADQRRFTRVELINHAIVSALKALVWVTPMAVFSHFAPGAVVGAAWAYIAVMILASAITRFSAPLASVVYITVLGFGAAVGLAYAGWWELAAVSVLSAALGSQGAVESARAAFTARIAEAGMEEKSQVVSLLLREYEESAADWLFQLDTSRRLRQVSPRLAYALRRDPKSIEGESLIQLISGNAWISGRFPPSLHELADRLKSGQSFSNLTVEVSIEGERHWWELSATPIFDESGRHAGFRGVGSDVTAQRESSEKIAFLARYDTLTSLPNRLMVNEALSDALTYAEKWRTRCAFLMIDLDRFKSVNDSLGHMVGDRMLAQVAARLKTIIGEGETCGRLGGDEFGIVIRDASDKSRIEAVATALIEKLSEPYKIENHILYVGASVGSAIGPRDGKSVEELMRNADLALYRAKDSGGGEHRGYEPSLHALAEERRQLEFALRGALKNDEFSLQYQPVVDAHTHEVVSFEALARWNNADHGAVSPAKFIPLAEETRLIVPIGKWVLNEACNEAAKAWPSHIKVNVNVSPEQLIEPDFATTVVQALARSGLAAERLEIEVTESIFLRDANIARKALERVMALGCSVALDDFGTGYSSLGYLRKLQFSTIKIDRTFVQGASQSAAESLAIIRAVVAMADSLGMTTTAEGVETSEEAELIRNLGCTKIQGYYFGRPMQAEDASKMFGREGGRQSA